MEDLVEGGECSSSPFYVWYYHCQHFSQTQIGFSYPALLSYLNMGETSASVWQKIPSVWAARFSYRLEWLMPVLHMAWCKDKQWRSIVRYEFAAIHVSPFTEDFGKLQTGEKLMLLTDGIFFSGCKLRLSWKYLPKSSRFNVVRNVNEVFAPVVM